MKAAEPVVDFDKQDQHKHKNCWSWGMAFEKVKFIPGNVEKIIFFKRKNAINKIIYNF
jgi:hypothetical protein